MKRTPIIAAAGIIALVLLRFPPGMTTRAVETGQEPVTTQARRPCDRQIPRNTVLRQAVSLPAPSIAEAGNSVEGIAITATRADAHAAHEIGRPDSNATPQRTGNAGHALTLSRSIQPAKKPAVTASPVTAEDAEPVSNTETTVVSTRDPGLQPAAWADLGSASTLTPAQDHEVQQMAEELAARLSHSGLDPASPEYRRLWDDAVRESDFIFMQRYGGEAWEAHHVEAYHLAHHQH